MKFFKLCFFICSLSIICIILMSNTNGCGGGNKVISISTFPSNYQCAYESPIILTITPNPSTPGEGWGELNITVLNLDGTIYNQIHHTLSSNNLDNGTQNGCAYLNVPAQGQFTIGIIYLEKTSGGCVQPDINHCNAWINPNHSTPMVVSLHNNPSCYNRSFEVNLYIGEKNC